MRKLLARLFLLTTQLLLVAAFACFVASCVGKHWCGNNASNSAVVTKEYFGLLSYCREDSVGLVCDDRISILQFKSTQWPFSPLKSTDFDIILITIIVAMVFIVLALIVSFLMFCASSGRKRWRIISTTVALMTAVSVASSIVGIAYFESKLADERLNRIYKHAWSSIIAWVGFGLLVVDTVLIIVVSRVKPDDHSKKPHSVRESYASSETRETWASSRDNKGFEFADIKDPYYVGKNNRNKRETPHQHVNYNRSNMLKNDPSKNYKKEEYGSPRGSTDFDYQHGGNEANELVYDPRRRAQNLNISPPRRRSIESAFDRGVRVDDSYYEKVYREPDSSYDRSRYHNSSYSPRGILNSSYNSEESSQPALKYDPSKRTRGSSRRYPSMDNNGYHVR